MINLMKQAHNNLITSYLFTWYGAPVSLANKHMMMTTINNCANREVTMNFIGY